MQLWPARQRAGIDSAQGTRKPAPAGIAPALGAALALLALAPAVEAFPRGLAQAGPSTVPADRALLAPLASPAARRARLPGRFVVRGRPLARRRRVVAGRSVSVFAKPAVVTVEGCRSRRPRVRMRRGRALVSVTARCEGIRGRLRLRGTIRGATLRGTATRGRRVRRFSATVRQQRGTLLRGRRSRRALRAVRDTDFLARHSSNELSRVGRGTVVRTELVLRFRSRATVGQVNQALRAVGGRIAGSLADSPRLVVGLPDPGSPGALDRLLRSLRRMTGVRRAARAYMPVLQELPPGFASPPSSGQAANLSHLLAMRMPAAWNARRAIRLAERPTMIVADSFGNRVPGVAQLPQVDADVAGVLVRRSDCSALRGAGVICPNEHGYHVVGIAAAAFANNGSPGGIVTGVFPAQARLRVIDVVGKSLAAAGLAVAQAAKQQPGRVVINTSLGNDQATDAEARADGSDWANDIRRSGLEGRVVHAASAGNAAREATTNSPFAPAALRGDLTDPAGDHLAPLRNTLAVENLMDTGAPRFESGCLFASSNRAGNIAAVGSEVFSHRLSGGAGNKTGTSMASPQVAGLAELLWSIAPDLTALQIVNLMIATAAEPLPNDAGNCGTLLPSAPRLDAYSAVLNLDQAALPTPASAPVRLAILDRNGDGAFDQADLATLAPAVRADTPERDWSRADLNGDGFTGTAFTAPIDLDPRTSTRAAGHRLEEVTQTIEGVPVRFDERNVSDAEVLCYYAFTELYTGDAEPRKELLREPCDINTPPGTVTLDARDSILSRNATASAGGGSCSEQDPDDGVQPPDATLTGPGTFAPTVDLTRTASCPDATANSAIGGNTSHQANITGGGQLSASMNANLTAEAHVTTSAQDGAANAQADVGTGMDLEVTVKGSVTLSCSGSFDATPPVGDPVDLNVFVSGPGFSEFVTSDRPSFDRVVAGPPTGISLDISFNVFDAPFAIADEAGGTSEDDLESISYSAECHTTPN